MIILASSLIAALLPTGSSMWLNQYPDNDQGFYPSLSTACFYKELDMNSFLRRGPKIWSMIFSVVIVAVSYTHCGIRLFDPTASTSRKYLRTLPGSKAKQVLHATELNATSPGLAAHLWHVLYLVLRRLHQQPRLLRHLRVHAPRHHLTYFRHGMGHDQSVGDTSSSNVQLRRRSVYVESRCAAGELMVVRSNITVDPPTTSFAIDGASVIGQRLKYSGANTKGGERRRVIHTKTSLINVWNGRRWQCPQRRWSRRRLSSDAIRPRAREADQASTIPLRQLYLLPRVHGPHPAPHLPDHNGNHNGTLRPHRNGSCLRYLLHLTE
jgi:phage baseplate assembly protein gpV